MRFKTFIYFIFTIALTSCETLVTEIPQSELPSIASKLVVNSYISPQSATTIVVVTESIPLYGETTSTNKVVSNAIVKLSDGVKEITMPYDTSAKAYTITQAVFPIKAAQTYKLTVSDATRSVNATCTVPAKLATIQSYVLDTATVRDVEGRDSALTLKMTWIDIQNDKNFYRVRAYTELEYSVLQVNTNKDMIEKRVKGRFNFDWDDNSGRSSFQNDLNLDGVLFTSPLGKATLPTSILYFTPDGNSVRAKQKVKLLSLTMELLNCDQAYYDFHRSLDLNRNSDNPFSEPSLIFTNINGGLGCFAAYNSRVVIYKPK